ncbi:hypothetical protein RclHR1_11640008 [Rhizophagus clarus]|uniref:DNA helicase n=1 Tax=Rhizophagus clarus TaxID=94130 RepID=A0A2Z6Q4Z1_9GLOM|nr:hypothetical protein RclHR1_11640008 [Rhizophagus clarus]
MVSADLLSFISDLFTKLHNKPIKFGGIPILLIGDLAQLPPVKGAQVFFSPVWKIFFPLFLTFSRRQQNDLPFYSLLQNVSFGIITDNDKKMIFEKHATIDSQLPSLQLNQSPLISIAKDYYNDGPINTDETDKMFNKHTNYPREVILKEGCQVMFLNIKYFFKRVYNGSIGVVLRVLNESLIEVVFSISTGMVIMKVKKDTAYFVINGSSTRRTQFPLQNAFSLTVHKRKA